MSSAHRSAETRGYHKPFLQEVEHNRARDLLEVDNSTVVIDGEGHRGDGLDIGVPVEVILDLKDRHLTREGTITLGGRRKGGGREGGEGGGKGERERGREGEGRREGGEGRECGETE